MTTVEQRFNALELATPPDVTVEAPDVTVARAAAFYAFLAAADQPDAAPVATPTRRKAADKTTEAVVETPTVTGDAASTTSSDANAGSGSPEEQRAEDTPAVVDVADLNAKVLSAVKELGRDATVAILNSHGGGKVPEVPVENHPALLAELVTALAAKADAGSLT